MRDALPRGRQWFECLALAVVYVLTARLGQLFSIDPGNVTPVWLPSGIILAAVVWRPYLWPGIWLGAFVGNAWAYTSFSDPLLTLRALAAGTSNGIGDVLCALIGAAALQGEKHAPHRDSQRVLRLVAWAAVLGSLVSAVFGIGALTALGFLPSEQALVAGSTWWAGDAVGVLLIGAPLLAFSDPVAAPGRPARRWELAAFWLLLPLAGFVNASSAQLGGVSFPELLLLPLIGWSVLRLPDTNTYLACVVVCLIQLSGVLLSPAGGQNTNALLIEAQLFTAIVFVVAMLMMALRHQQEAATAALEQMRDEALRSSQEKSRFLSMMSHEIRTPMNGIVGMSDLLLETPLQDEQARFASGIQECSRHLVLLTREILDYSRIQVGELTVDQEPLHVGELVDSIEHMFHLQAKEAGLEFGVTVAPACRRWVTGDEVRVRQILINLLSNAIRYTSEGRVWLSVSAEGDRYRFDVSDTGTGIPPSQQARIFEPFRQAFHSRSSHGGTGLGLYLSRELATRMGGTLTLHSETGAGCVFTLRLVLPPGQRSLAPDRLPPLAGHILLVEDNAVNRLVGQRMLEQLGLEVTIAHDGAEALVRLPDAAPSLILMDCHMPHLDGFEATRRIRAMAGPLSTIPILALTANATTHDRAACLEAGMNKMLTKPITLTMLHRELSPFLAAPAAPRAAAAR